MQLMAGIMGIILAFSSMWLGWYVLRVWPDLYEEVERDKQKH
jgi:hypothetical protein